MIPTWAIVPATTKLLAASILHPNRRKEIVIDKAAGTVRLIERPEEAAEAQLTAEAQIAQYARMSAAASDPAEQITKAKALLDSETIDEREFDAIKAKALGSG